MKKHNNQPNPLRGLLVAGGLYNHSTATSDCSESYANGNDHDDEDEDDDDDDNDNSETGIGISNNNSKKRRRDLEDQDSNLKFGNLERDTGMGSTTGNKRVRLAHHSSECGSDFSKNEDLEEDERVISVS